MVFPRYVQVLKWRFPVGISIINQLFWGTPIYGNPQMVHVLKCPKPERITSAAEMQWPELRLERQAATRKQGFHRAQCGIFHGIVGVVSIYEDNSIGYFMDILYIYIYSMDMLYIYITYLDMVWYFMDGLVGIWRGTIKHRHPMG